MARVTIENLYKTYESSSSNQTFSHLNLGAGVVTPSNANDTETVKNNSPSPVLKGINFEIEEGEFMVLVGPSGCGKSTLLRLIAGLEEITAGKIKIGDRTVNDLPPKARDIAMVFQNYALYPHLTVYDNIAFGLRRMNRKGGNPPPWKDKVLDLMMSFFPPPWRYLSATEKQIQTTVNQVAQMLQIEHLLSRLPKQLSGGQKQRVALGRAIARNPQVFLMDEPLSNLDAKLRTETRISIVKLQKELKVTTIYVTHDQTEALTMGDRIAVINQGEILQVASPLEIYQNPINTFVAQFIGSPPMNLLEVNYEKPNVLRHSHFKIVLEPPQQNILKDYNYEKIVMGIRPESFILGESSEFSIPVIVNLVEVLGHETILTVNLVDNSQQNLQVKLFTEHQINLGGKLNLKIDLNRVNFFDSYQGRNLKFS